MVQLEDDAGRVVLQSKEDFNSSMVQLEDSFATSLSFSNAFQFQYGAIRRWKYSAGKISNGYFNSSMVQLEENRTKWYDRCSSISIPVWCN